MSGTPFLFIDGDEALVGTASITGTSNLSNLGLQPGVIPALLSLLRAGYRLVRVSDPGRPGGAPDLLQALFASQGIEFDSTPVAEWLSSAAIDRKSSRVIGDREAEPTSISRCASASPGYACMATTRCPGLRSQRN